VLGRMGIMRVSVLVGLALALGCGGAAPTPVTIAGAKTTPVSVPTGFAASGRIERELASLEALDAAHPDTRPGRYALFSQNFAFPARLPAEEAVATLRDFWASPSLSETLREFSDYRFEAPQQLRGVPVTIAWGIHDRLLPYRLQAPRARALLPWATHVTLGAGHVPFYDDPAAAAEVVRACARRAAATPAPVA